jgi:cation diffusion facilitator family transporter
MAGFGDTATRTAAASIAVAFFVMGIKYVAYLKTGSVALFSDALESIVNVATAALALWAVSYSTKPADQRHPFGHHKAEYFSAVFTGVMIVLAALAILDQAWTAYTTSRAPGAYGEGLFYGALATGINAAWAGWLVRQGTKWRSPALVADGWHLYSDVITSVGVLVGFILVWLTGWIVLDPLAAAIVAINILWSGLKVMRDSLAGLMDESVEPNQLETIRNVISEHSGGALEMHDLRARRAGQAVFIEFHLVVPGDMPVRDAHAICDRIEEAVRKAVAGARILIHVEPEEKAKTHGALVF